MQNLAWLRDKFLKKNDYKFLLTRFESVLPTVQPKVDSNLGLARKGKTRGIEMSVGRVLCDQ